MGAIAHSPEFLLSLNPFAIAGLMTALFAFVFGLFVFLQNTRSVLYRKWLTMSFFIGLWGVGAFFIAIAVDPTLSYIAWKSAFGIGVVWIPPVFLNFVFEFCDMQRKRFMRAVYLSGAFFSFSALFTPYFFQGIRFIFGSFYYGVPDFRIFAFFLIWWFGLTIYTHYVLIKAYPTATEPKKLQIRYFFIAVAVGFLTGSLAYLPFFHIDLYPWGTFGIPLYVIIMSYAVAEHQLLEINIAVKNALISSVIVALIAWGLLLLGVASNLLVQQFNIPFWLTTLIGAVIAFLIGSAFWQRAKNLDRLKYEFILVAAHKLRTPVTEIRWAASELGSVKSAADAKPIETIIDSATDQLLDLIKSLLESVQTGDKSYVYRFETCDISELAQAVLEARQYSLSKKKLRATFESHAHRTLVRADSSRLTEALQILLDNAIMYTPQGGTIRIEIDDYNNGDSLILRVHDGGIGIAKADQRHLFERLYRGHNALLSYPDGSGLGLFMTKQILDRHGGIVGASSEGLNKGSTFWFILPALKPERATA